MKKIEVIKNLDFSHFIYRDYISKKYCSKIIEELNNFNKFDDNVMDGRNRINKGSKNFKNFLNKSKNSKKIYDKLNSIKFFNFLKKKIKYKKFKWNEKKKKYHFSKKIFGSQSGKKITEIETDQKKNIVYLDLDFSVSTKGYNRGAHIDRNSRIINFLIYLNNLDEKDGGVLELFNIKQKFLKTKRFIDKKNLKLIKRLKAKAGTVIFFLSSPDSYHSVSKFVPKNKKKRFFIYGSYSLNKKVIWQKNKEKFNEKFI